HPTQSLHRWNQKGGEPAAKADQESRLSLARRGGTVSQLPSLYTSLANIDGAGLLPDSLLNDVASRTNSFRSSIDALKNTVDQFCAQGAPASLDVANFTAQISGGPSLNIASALPPIVTNLDPLLHSIQILRAITTPAAGIDFGPAIDAINNVRNEQRLAFRELSRERKTFAAAKERINAAEQEIKTIVDSLRTTTTDAVEQRKAAADARTEAEGAKTGAATALQEISSVRAQAQDLERAVQAYKSTFSSFQTELDARNNTFVKGKTDLDNLLTRLAAAEKELERITARARDVLGEATVAGLSERFYKETQDIGGRLFWAHVSLVGAVAFFAFSSLLAVSPSFADYILGTASPNPITLPENAAFGVAVTSYLGLAVGKIILIAPSAVLVAYTAKRALSLFRLRAEYTYKYTVASSLPGFKIEAPQYAEAMTASAFKELLYNPVEIETSDRPRNKWLDKIINPRVAAAFDRMLSNITEK
ncbi:MAG: hypothetical protein ACOY3L_06935, partial [Pseudomonadota bacterium]